MKPPKEPKTWKYPRLYWAEFPYESMVFWRSAEFIVIYPDGHAERSPTLWSYERGSFWHTWSEGHEEVLAPCWRFGCANNPEGMRQAMLDYANEMGFKRIFVGEIK